MDRGDINAIAESIVVTNFIGMRIDDVRTILGRVEVLCEAALPGQRTRAPFDPVLEMECPGRKSWD